MDLPRSTGVPSPYGSPARRRSWRGHFLMEDVVRTNPTSTLTVRDYADATRPDSLKGLSDENFALALEDADRRGMDLARRLGVDRSDRRLPVYIWAIVFGEKAV